MRLAGKLAAAVLAASLTAGSCAAASASPRQGTGNAASRTAAVTDPSARATEHAFSNEITRTITASDRSDRQALPASLRHDLAHPVLRTMKAWDVQTKDTGGTLLFSDSPEYVNRDGILYSDTVQGDARVLFYHLNNTDVTKKVAVVLENHSDQYTIIHVTRGGMSQPSSNYLEVGKGTQVEYFDQQLNGKIYIGKGEKRLLQDDMDSTVLQPGQLVYGVFDFSSKQPVRVSVIMYPADANPLDFIKDAVVLPKDEHRLRGTFRGMDRIISSSRAYDPRRDGIVYIPIGDNERDTYRTGIDATDGSLVTNYGNYGVLYRISIPMRGDYSARYFLSPLGGVYAGAMRVDYGRRSNLLLTPGGRTYFGDATPPESQGEVKARDEGTATLSHYTELADLGTYDSKSEPSFEYSPPGASNLPVNLILMPAAEHTLAPNEKRR